MEEVKHESAKEEVCACRHAGMTCSGSTHRYCFKRCCMLRCFVMVVVLAVVFAAGMCAGGHHGRGEYGRHGYSHHHMMLHGGWDSEGKMGGINYGYYGSGGERVIMMQRTVGNTPTMMTATTSTIR